jgi:S1-C subfamily serine protease
MESFKPGVVRIINEASKLKGSGFIFRIDLDKKEVYIVTVAHILNGTRKPKVEFYIDQDKPVEATIKILNEEMDLAVILVRGNKQIPEGIMALNILPSVRLSGGDRVIVIGSPRLGVPWSIVEGSVEAVQGGEVFFSGNIGEGISGSPLLKDNQDKGAYHQGRREVWFFQICIRLSSFTLSPGKQRNIDGIHPWRH